MIHVGPYTIYTTRQRPWASVYDADGFPDTFCNTYVTFGLLDIQGINK